MVELIACKKVKLVLAPSVTLWTIQVDKSTELEFILGSPSIYPSLYITECSALSVEAKGSKFELEMENNVEPSAVVTQFESLWKGENYVTKKIEREGVGYVKREESN
jgi:hypothetical protein